MLPQIEYNFEFKKRKRGRPAKRKENKAPSKNKKFKVREGEEQDLTDELVQENNRDKADVN